MQGSNIVVSADVQAFQFKEGIIGTGVTAYPGSIMQIDFSVAPVGGRHTWVLYNRDADGNRPAGPLIILTEDRGQGRDYSTPYTAGERCSGIVPLPGQEFNCLIGDVSGTADAHTKGEILIVDDGTGELIATTGSPESEPFVLCETLAALTADTPAWVMYSGY